LGALTALLFFGGEVSALPPQVDVFFQHANVYFDSVNVIHDSTNIPEIEKIELKTYFLNNGLKNQKDGKKGAFGCLEAMIDTFPPPLFHRPYPGLPADVEAYFDSANFYFDSVNYVHNLEGGLSSEIDSYFQKANIYFDSINVIHSQPPSPDVETLKIENKLHCLELALKDQKHAMMLAFGEIEAKLDTLLGWPFPGTLPQDVEFYFFTANQYFDSVNLIHEIPPAQMPEIEKVELKLHYLKHALIFEKEAKWWMFRELEKKIEATGVEEIQGDATKPDKFTLLQNYPNPFNPQTRIEFVLDKPSLVTVYIYNILGKKVKRVLEQKLKAGHYAIDWDGKDEKGNEVSSGIYFYRVQAGSMVQAKKMVLLK